MDGDFWDWLKIGSGAGAGFIGVLAVFHFIFKAGSWAFEFFAGRQDASHKHLIDVLNEVQEELGKCRQREEQAKVREDAAKEREAKLTKRVAELEGVSMGIGALRENEQLIRALVARIDKLEGER